MGALDRAARMVDNILHASPADLRIAKYRPVLEELARESYYAGFDRAKSEIAAALAEQGVYATLRPLASRFHEDV